MRAAVFHSSDRTLSIEEVSAPELRGRDLIIAVKCCGICGSDLHAAAMPGALPEGCVMGHEFSGEVVEVGPEAIKDFRVGDRVTALPSISCGQCEACLTGDVMACSQLVVTGLGEEPGAYAEYLRVGSAEALRLPDGVDFRMGALVEPLAVGLHAVRSSRLVAGEDVLIVGAGPIGLATALWARFFGARNILVQEPVADRREMALQMGATAGVDGAAAATAAMADEWSKAGADVIFECVGVPGLLMECIELAAPNSRILVAGVCMQPDTILPLAAILKQLELRFVLGYHLDDFQFTLDMMAAGRIDGNAMVTDVVDLAGLPGAFESLRKPSGQCKVLLEPQTP